MIADIFSDSHETEIVRNLRGDAAQSFVDIADKVLLFFHPDEVQ